MARKNLKPRLGRPLSNPRPERSESPLIRALQAAYVEAGKPPLDDVAAEAGIARTSARMLLWVGDVPKSVAIIESIAAALGCEVGLVRKREPRVKG